MAVTAYKFAGTASSETRTGESASTPEWNNPNNAKVDDANYADCSADKDEYGSWLRLTNFSMGVTAGATIDGIEVEIKRIAAIADKDFDSALYLRKTTTGQVGSNYADANAFDTTAETITYGGATDKWGTTWSAADVNHANFGIDLSTMNVDNMAMATDIFFIKIRVHYTAAATGTNMTVNVDDVDKDIDNIYVQVDEAWKEVSNAYVNVDNSWKTIF